MAKSKNSPKNGGYTPRGSGLSKTFMKDMKSYSFLIEYANNEANGLDVQLRGEYINIYYKGGNLIKLSGRKSCVFSCLVILWSESSRCKCAIPSYEMFGFK